MSSVLTFTVNPCIDLNLEVDRLREGGKNRARLRRATGGGGGINVARGVVRLGGSATALHTAGGDVGRRLNRLLDQARLDHRPIEVGGETREAVVLIETCSGRSFHVVPPGPTLDERDGRRCLDVLAKAAGAYPYVVVSGSLPHGLPGRFYADAAARVKAAGSRLVLDTSGVGLVEALGEGAFLVRLNRREAAGLVGRSIEDFDDARAVNDRLLGMGAVEVCVTTVGARGALCSTRHGHTEIHAPPLPSEPLSDVGAGDSLVAGLTLRLAEGDDLVEACAHAVAVAAATVLTPGSDLFDPATVAALRPQVRTRRVRP
ncbi:MAG TPA: hexose kinase [Jiangellales bacterium]|nr:hexose kinase [Jiangellales bacterium]